MRVGETQKARFLHQLRLSAFDQLRASQQLAAADRSEGDGLEAIQVGRRLQQFGGTFSSPLLRAVANEEQEKSVSFHTPNSSANKYLVVEE